MGVEKASPCEVPYPGHQDKLVTRGFHGEASPRHREVAHWKDPPPQAVETPCGMALAHSGWLGRHLLSGVSPPGPTCSISLSCTGWNSHPNSKLSLAPFEVLPRSRHHSWPIHVYGRVQRVALLLRVTGPTSLSPPIPGLKGPTSETWEAGSVFFAGLGFVFFFNVYFFHRKVAGWTSCLLLGKTKGYLLPLSSCPWWPQGAVSATLEECKGLAEATLSEALLQAQESLGFPAAPHIQAWCQSPVT